MLSIIIHLLIIGLSLCGNILQEMVDYLAALYIALYGLYPEVITLDGDDLISELRAQNRTDSKKNP